MKKNNKKKGFTIVELVIVIAVIAILSTILIPTISGVVANANKAAKQEEIRVTVLNAIIKAEEKGEYDGQNIVAVAIKEKVSNVDTVVYYEVENGVAVPTTDGKGWKTVVATSNVPSNATAGKSYVDASGVIQTVPEEEVNG